MSDLTEENLLAKQKKEKKDLQSMIDYLSSLTTSASRSIFLLFCSTSHQFFAFSVSDIPEAVGSI
jgi:hypothetical protein